MLVYELGKLVPLCAIIAKMMLMFAMLIILNVFILSGSDMYITT
jgi:hypothetical protein